jgi:hypothetical protein
MKRRSYLISFIIILTVILVATFTAFATSAQETALSTGDRNVAFSNGYYGFCLDVNLKGAKTGDTFTSAGSTSAALSNKDNSEISQYLKVLFTQCFGDVFVSDGNGGYQVKDTNTIQAIVWHFSDGQYIWGEQSRLVNLVKAYTGPAIPDDGYTLQLDNGDIITFYFTVMLPDNSALQDFFAYKIVVGQTPSHVHNYDKDWSFDENEHWLECECGEKSDKGGHSGGSANCETPAECKTCGQPYGEKDKDAHSGGTVIKGYVPATESAPGYTGDTHCVGCDAKLADGEPIPRLHVHNYDKDWSFDENEHWLECECGDKKDREGHVYQGGVCVECNTVDPSGTPPETSDNFALCSQIVLLLLSVGGSMWALRTKKRHLS